MRIYDISHTLHEDLPVWPGDWKFTREASSRIISGRGSNSSNIRTALHCGTHLDAPRHTIEEGLTVDQLDPAALIGPVRVLSVGKSVIRADDLRHILDKDSPRRLIVRCPGIGELDKFTENFPVPGAEAARALVESGFLVYGTDAPSVDPLESEDLHSHRILLGGGVIILENLFLEEVPDGEYLLIALPLKIKGADGSPVRAVLMGD